jgi:hypothetical protein
MPGIPETVTAAAWTVTRGGSLVATNQLRAVHGSYNRQTRQASFIFALIASGLMLVSYPAPADGQTLAVDQTSAPKAESKPTLRGYLNARYAYVGSSSAATVYSGLRLTGSFQLSALSDRITFKYRSHHWLNFERPPNSVLESPFEDRHILQTVSIETDGLLVRGLKFKLGRFLPETDYSSAPPIDGGACSLEFGSLSIGGDVGRIVDVWNGKQQSTDLLAAAQVKYRTERFSAAAGFQSASYLDRKQKELPAGFAILLRKYLWIDANASYEFESKELARAGLNVSWRGEAGSVSLMASQWRNPFDQLSLLDKSRNLTYWGLYSESVPSTYQDVRLSGSLIRNGWGVRSTLGVMAGVRSGWLTSAYVTSPSLRGFRASLGGQAMKSDFIEFLSVDVMVTTQVHAFAFQVQSQFRSYQWIPRPSGFRNVDNFSEVSVEYPLRRHLYLSTAAGGFFRTLGNEGFKPQAEVRLIARI